MNAKGKAALREAETQGVRQVYWKLFDRSIYNSACAVAVLLRAASEWKPIQDIQHHFKGSLPAYYGLSTARQQCAACPMELHDEWDLTIHYNNIHKFTFSQIADLLPDTKEKKEESV